MSQISITASLLVGLGLYALATGLEAALSSLGEAKINQEAEGGRKSFLFLVNRAERVSATLALLRVLGLVLAALAGAELLRALHGLSGVLWGALPMALALLVSADLLPRAWARQNSFGWALAALPLVRALGGLLWPLVALVELLSRLLGRLGGENGGQRPASITPEQLEYMIDLGVKEGVLDRENSELLSSVLEFSDIVTREVMVPRLNVVALPVSASREEVLQLIQESEHSRIPVFESSIDEIVGVLHVKTFLSWLHTEGEGAASIGPAPTKTEPFDLRRHLTPPFFVPELMKISRLLREFQKRRTHLAVVVDEFGGTAGVAALEDVVEEIVGDIQDELDVEEGRVKVLPDGALLADAATTLRDLEDQLEIDFPDEHDYDSLGGFITHMAGKVPPVGSVVLWNDLRFTVKAGDERRVTRVEICRVKELPAPALPDAPGGT